MGTQIHIILDSSNEKLIVRECVSDCCTITNDGRKKSV